MHALIINGSPRVKKYSNTDKILEKFTEGMCTNGSTFEQYEVSDRNQWEDIRRAYYENRNILIAIPLFVECIPGLLLEFLETLTPKNDGTELAFILQGGFAEGSQLRCGKRILNCSRTDWAADTGALSAKAITSASGFLRENKEKG